MEHPKKSNTIAFDLETFKQKALDKWKSGTPLNGKDDTLSPLLRQLVNKAIRRTNEFSAAGDYDMDEKTARDFRKESIIKFSRGYTDNVLDFHQEIKNLNEENQENDEINRWLNRTLNEKYLVVWLFSGRVKTDQKKAIQFAVGLNYEGFRDVLGIYCGSEARVAEDLHARGVREVPVFVIDQPDHYSGSVSQYFSSSDIQICVIHQVLDTMKLILSSNRKSFFHGLQGIFKAGNGTDALARFSNLELEWGTRYPHVFMILKKNWNGITALFRYPESIRKVISAAGTIEALHRQLRKKAKSHSEVPVENNLVLRSYKDLYYHIYKPKKQSLHNWDLILSQMDGHCSGSRK